MRTPDPHDLLLEARETLRGLETRRERLSAEHGSGEFAPRSPMRQIARIVSAAESRVERRQTECGCDTCELRLSDERSDRAADHAYDKWKDERLTRGVRGRE